MADELENIVRQLVAENSKARREEMTRQSRLTELILRGGDMGSVMDWMDEPDDEEKPEAEGD